MNDIFNKKTNRVHVETFAAIQTVKYNLRARKQSSVSRYKGINFLYSPINRKLCRPMPLSYQADSEKFEALNQNRKRRNEILGVEPTAKRRKVSIHKKAPKLKRKLLKKR